MNDSESKKLIYIKSENHLFSSICNLFHCFVERIILHKWDWIKNKPRSNYLILRSILSVLTSWSANLFADSFIVLFV